MSGIPKGQSEALLEGGGGTQPSPIYIQSEAVADKINRYSGVAPPGGGERIAHMQTYRWP